MQKYGIIRTTGKIIVGDALGRPRWMNDDVLLISLSAFFADLGYQTVQALFPIFLVVTLASSPVAFGMANALAFGGGAVLAYVGGVLSDRHSRKWIVVIGSAFILLMSATGLSYSPVIAIALFVGGWWGRNLRVPPRRAMLTDASRRKDLGKAFGFLHALDIGGGLVAVVLLLALLSLNVSQNSILLITALPLSISLIIVLMIRDIRKSTYKERARRSAESPTVNMSAFKGIVFATALYGFSYYSLGFPILTLAKVTSNNLIAIGSYGVYLGVSAITGYYIGSRKGINTIRALGWLGYIISGIGTAILAIASGLGFGAAAFYIGVALMGFGLGVVETMEPTIISLIKKDVKLGKGMGALTGSRSFGIFSANVIMGLLYVISPADSYTYAAAVSIIAGAIVLWYGRKFRS